MIVSLYMVISFEPTNDARSDMLIVEANAIGGFGAVDAVVLRLVVAMISFCYETLS
jgi:hypothetical protein